MQDIVNERVVSFINSFDKRNSPICNIIEKEAREQGVPIIRKEMESFLRTMLRLTGAKDILEIGAAVGYSSIFMSRNMADGAHITTIENYPPRIERAKANIALAGMEDKITLIPGDAAEVLKELSGSWDFIFMDAAKGHYIHFMPEVMRLLAPGGILVSDNVLQDGDIFESRYGIKRRNHTIHNRMREYLYALTHDEAFDTVILETGDGMAISVKKE